MKKSKKPKKPLCLQLEIDGYQEDEIVGVSLKETYRRIKSIDDVHEYPEDREAFLKGLKLVYHYYTGKNLK